MRRVITRAAAALGLALAAGLSLPAQALTFHSGDSFVFDFDFTGQTPAAPYDSIASRFNFTGIDFADQATFDIFTGLGATGTNLASGNFFLALSAVLLIPSDVGTADGVYSVRLHATQGEFELTGASAQAFVGTADVSIEIELPTGAIPEPASLALTGGGVLAAAAFRRRVRR